MGPMTKNYQRGFGFGTLVVIIALVLIVGGYIYYTGQNATPTSSGETPYPLTGQPMETIDVASPTSSSTSTSTAS